MIDRLEQDLSFVSQLDDNPNDATGMSAAELKATFDRAGNVIKEYINETLIPSIGEGFATGEDIDKLHSEIVDVTLGQIPDNSLTEEKLGEEVRAKLNSAAQVGDSYTKAENLDDGTKSLYGLGEEAVPDDVFRFLSRLNQHVWSRRTVTTIPAYYELGESVNQTISASGGGSNTFDITRGTSLSISRTGDITLNDTSTITVSYNTYTTANELKGYFYQNTDGVYVYTPTDAADATRNSSSYRVQIYGQPVTTFVESHEYGEWEFLYSPDRNAYPDIGISDGYEYAYMGVPFNNAVYPPTRVKMMELEDTIGGAHQIDVGLSGINLADWRYLEIDHVIVGDAGSHTMGYVRLNSISDNAYIYSTNPNSKGASAAYLVPYSTSYGNTPGGTYAGNGTIRLWCVGDAVFAQNRDIYVNGTELYPYIRTGCVKTSAMKASELKSLNFCAFYDSETMVAGSKITVYGVKK